MTPDVPTWEEALATDTCVLSDMMSLWEDVPSWKMMRRAECISDTMMQALGEIMPEP